ncbi:MAG: DUF4382 domain-containing protein [Chitinophagaceae bacterium]|nr:DUF4382 domain-containing protein [Chitinophagaceae bacterium]
MTIRKLSVIAAAVFSALIFNSCEKENSSGQTDLKIKMTDNPFDATEVNVDIREINVKMNDSTSNWVTLNTTSAVYNLLDFQNGIDTVLAQGMVPTGTLKEIRFVLGDDNSIMIDNVLYPLTIPSGSESGLKLKLNKNLNATADSLLIDFDAALSVIKTGNGEYKLKPVLKIK